MENMTEYEKAQNLAIALEKYASLEGAEIGETCLSLIYLVRCISYVSEDFYTALLKEIKIQLKNFKDNSRIVENEKIVRSRTKSIEWSGIDY